MNDSEHAAWSMVANGQRSRKTISEGEKVRD